MLCINIDLTLQALQTYGKFSNYCRKSTNIQMNSELWILIKVQCVIYQWISLDKLNKLMESFFIQILKSFFQLTTFF